MNDERLKDPKVRREILKLVGEIFEASDQADRRMATGLVLVIEDPEVKDGPSVWGPYPLDGDLATKEAALLEAELNDSTNDGEYITVRVRYLFPPGGEKP